MKKQHMEKRWISILLCAAMLAGTIPVTALAGTPGSTETAQQSESAQETGIDYKKNGGTFAEGYDPPESYPVSELPTKEQITKDGYEFDGWYENEDFSGEEVTSLDTASHTGNIVLYAKWKERYYYVDIPENVSANTEELMVTANAGGLYDKDYVSVSVESENNWKLKSGQHELDYELREKTAGTKLENDALVTSLTKEKSNSTQNYKFNILDQAKYTGTYTDQLTFGLSFQDTKYRITYKANGGTAYKENPEKSGEMIEVTDEIFPAGTVLDQLPEAVKKSSTFLGWCYDEACTKYVGSSDRLLKDTTLYAAYSDNQKLESTSMATYARAVDVGTDFTIDVTDTSESLTADQIRSACTIKNVSDSSEEITLEVTQKSGHTFTISNLAGWKPGSSYRLELKEKAIYFTGFDKTIREYDFTVYKEEVENAKLNDKLKYIHISDLSNLVVNGKKADTVSVAVMTIGTDGSITQEGSDTTGTFTYKKQKLNAGDQIAVYTGDVIPTMDMSSGEDSDISFFEITGANGNQYSYRGSKAEDVLFMPEVLPLSREKDLDGLPDNNSVTVAKSDLTFGDDEMSKALQLDSGTTVDVGDYLALYTDVNSGTPSYGEITSVSVSGSQYIVAYNPVTWEEVQKTMDVYQKENVDGDELLEDTDTDKLEKDIETQAVDSGFATEVVENIAEAAMETQSFEELQESLNEDMGADISLQNIQGTDGRDYGMSLLAAAPGKQRVEAGLESVKADLGTTLRHFDGDVSGLRLALEIGVKITIHVNQKADIEILVTATFEQEVRVAINVDGQAVWKVWGIIPYIADYRATASLDLYEYTGVGLNVNFKTAETGFLDNGSKLRKGVNKITEELKSMMENGEDYIKDKTKFDVGIGDSGDEISVAKSLAQRYSELLNDESDWVEIYSRQLVNHHFRVILIIDIEVKLEFVVSANVNVSIGMTYWYKNAKRYVFCVYIKDRKATNDTIDLVEEQYEFTAYAMGTLGLKAGVRVTISIGLLSTKLASVGISAEAGGYVQVWGYLYYELKYTASAGRSNRAMGAVYLEIGIYLDVKFRAQALSNAFTYTPTLYENEWPLYKLGTIENVLDFAYTQSDVEEINMKRDIKSVCLSDDYFKMQYMHMKEGLNDGEYFEKIYEDDPKYFNIVMTNPAFSYDPERNIIQVNPGSEPEQDGEMLIIWKNQEGAFNTRTLVRKIKLHWDRLRDGYYIGFASNGGSYVNTITGKYNTDIKAPKDPVKQGYTFAGWYEDEALTKPYKIPSKMPDHDTLVYAKWEAADVDYAVVDYMEKTNGTYEEKAPVTYQAKTGSEVSPLPARRTGYTTPPQLSETVKADGSTVIRYYYARAEHKITFTSEGEVISEGTYKYGTTMPAPAVYMPGYEFIGWEEEGAENTEDAEVPETVPDKDATYIAKWKPKEGIIYTVKYYVQDSDGEGYTQSEMKILSGKTGEEVTAPDAGYSQKIYHRKGELPKGKITADGKMELRVYYDLNSYKLTLDAKGGMTDVTEITGKPGERISLPMPVRKGYIFEGWYLDEAYEQIAGDTMPDEDTTIYAKWEKQKVNYTVRHLWENIDESDPWETDEKESTYTLHEEETFSADADTKVTPEVKDYEGFTAPEKQTVKVKGDGSLVVEYFYKRNVHQMEIYADTKESYVMELQYGASIPGTQEKAGYLFGGWYEDEVFTKEYSGKMPDHDMTIYVKWIAQKCEYEVRHYLLDQRTEERTLADTETFETMSGTEVTPEVKAYEGYTAPDKRTEYIYGWGGEYIEYVYQKNIYNLTYVLNNGEKDKTEELGYAEEISYIPERSGYAFIGWYLDAQLTKPFTDTKMPAHALTLYAKWELGKKAYQVRHYLQKETLDDSYDLVETQNFTGTAGDEVTPEVMAYEGYTAPEKKTYTLKVSDESDTINYYYKRNSYQITFVHNDGSENTTEKLAYNSQVTYVPFRQGYRFKGWYQDAKFKNVFDGKVPAKDLTLYAKWEAEKVNYTVRYYLQNANDDGYTLSDTVTATADTGSSVTPEVKAFQGFTAPAAITDTVKGDGTLLIEYRYLRNTHKLVLKGYDGKEEESVTARYEMTIPVMFRDGYTFDGWYRDAEYQEKFGGTMPDADLTLYAKWTAKKVNYRVEYYKENLKDDGYTQSESISGQIQADSELEAPRKTDGYKGFITPEVQKVKVAGDGSTVVKYYYKRSIHTVRFVLGEGKEDIVITGKYKTPVKIENPVREGYEFAGWNETPVATIPDQDMVYTAVWKQKKYTLTFDMKNETNPVTQKYCYGDKIKLPDEVPEKPERTGYTFDKWSPEIPETMPDRSMTIEATWELKEYTIKYDLDGGVNNSENPAGYTYEDRVITLQNPEKPGYKFKYWTDENGEKVYAIPHNSTGDKKLTANWEEITYKIEFLISGEGAKRNEQYETYDTVKDVKYEEQVKLPEDIYVRDGYMFLGWSEEKDASEAQYWSGMEVSKLREKEGETIKLYPVWYAMTYTISFDFGDGQTGDWTRCKMGEKFDVPGDNGFKQGYTFKGWSKEGANTVTYTPGQKGIELYEAKDITLYGFWELNTSYHFDTKKKDVKYRVVDNEENYSFTFYPDGNCRWPTNILYQGDIRQYHWNINTLSIDGLKEKYKTMEIKISFKIDMVEDGYADFMLYYQKRGEKKETEWETEVANLKKDNGKTLSYEYKLTMDEGINLDNFRLEFDAHGKKRDKYDLSNLSVDLKFY